MREIIRNNWDRVRCGCIVLVVYLMLGCMLASCAAQEVPEAEPTQKETTQPKTADDYVSDGDFSTPCPVSGAAAGAVWFDNGHQVQTIDGTLAATDTLVVEAGVTVKANSPNTGWSVVFAVVLLDENGEYLCSFFDAKDGPTDSRDMSFICQEYSTLVVGNYGEPAEYELYVVRADFADGDSWGFADKDIGAVSSTDTGHEALKAAGELIGEGSIQHSGNASGNAGGGASLGGVSPSSSSVERYKQSDSSGFSSSEGEQLELRRLQEGIVFTLTMDDSKWSISSQDENGSYGGQGVMEGTVQEGLLVAADGAVYEIERSDSGTSSVMCIDGATSTTSLIEGEYTSE